jgi:hypothetical protein
VNCRGGSGQNWPPAKPATALFNAAANCGGLLEIKLTIKISGVKWTETAKVIRRGNAVVLEVMTKAGRLYRSTSFRLTKKEAAKLAAELQKAASSKL